MLYAKFKSIGFLLTPILLVGCASTDNIYSLTSKHPNEISGDVLPALMRTAKTRCESLNKIVQYRSFEQVSIEQNTSNANNTRTKLEYACVQQNLTDNTSPKAQSSNETGNEIPDASVRQRALGLGEPTSVEAPSSVHPNPEVPTSAEWKNYSENNGESAGMLPTKEQIEFLEQNPNLEMQTAKDKPVESEKISNSSINKNEKTVKKVNLKEKKKQTRKKANSRNYEVYYDLNEEGLEILGIPLSEIREEVH